MGVLNAAEIREHMLEADYSKKLLITPLLSEKQIGPLRSMSGSVRRSSFLRRLMLSSRT